MTSKTYLIELTEDQKELFDKWLDETEKDLEEKLHRLKSLRFLTSRSLNKVEVNLISENRSFKKQSWASKVIEILKKSESSQTSTQIIGWLMENDETLKDKDRRYITKNVTSKLAILVDNGRLRKEVIDGKNVYTLSNQAS